MRQKWVDQVIRTQEKWEPTEHSRLCSCHFDESCFAVCSVLASQFQLGKTKVLLKPDAVPTLFERMTPSQPKKQRSVICQHADFLKQRYFEDTLANSLEEVLGHSNWLTPVQ